MRAVICREPGVEDRVQLEEVADPALANDSVRISIAAAGVSFASLLVLQGKHQNTPEVPFTPGTEIAGIVLECGAAAKRFRPGDRVVAGTRSGGWAEQAVVPERTVFMLPAEIDFDAAVHFPTIYATAYASLKWRARVQPGEVLLVHGAGGGSGLAAVEIGKRLGAYVIAAAGTVEKLAQAGRHGADAVFNYRDQSIRDTVLELTRGRGADVIFDPVGGSVFAESMRCIAPEGRIIPMGFASGEIPQLAINLALVKNIDVIGVYWGYYFGWARATPARDNDSRLRAAFAEMFDWCSNGLLNPLTSGVYPLEQFRDAMAKISSREVIGRVALRPQG